MLSTLHLATAETMPFEESYIGRHSTDTVKIGVALCFPDRYN